jgi:hypothetical protein
MGIEEMIEIEEQADEFMKKAPEQREKLLYIAVLRTDRKVALIERDGCSRAEIVHGSRLSPWTPAAVGTLITTSVVAVLEWIRQGMKL